MKLVIDIDDSLYDAIQTEFYVNGMRSGKTLLQKLIATIRNGTPLDDIRKEIESNLITHGQVIEGEYYPDDAEAINYGLRKALEIIDRHIGSNDAEWKESEPLDDVVELIGKEQ